MIATFRPWRDNLTEIHGHHVASEYVETFWLPTLGPSALLMLRLLAKRLEASAGEPVVYGMADLAVSLGLGPGVGPNSTVVRTVERLVRFGVAYVLADGSVAVRQHLGSLPRHHSRRLPESLANELERWDRLLAESRAVEP